MPRPKKKSEVGAKQPKGKMTAYAFYVQTCREEHYRKNPEEKVGSVTEFVSKCAYSWKTMSATQKKKFNMLAEGDKRRYQFEMMNFNASSSSWTVPKKLPKKKPVRDPNAPRRNLASYLFFSKEEWHKINEEYPESSLGDIAKEVKK